MVMPAVTNKTACMDGYLIGYKNWCNNHSLDCVQNITSGLPMILQTQEQYNAGANAANGSGVSMSPIGENAVFCQGWHSNNDDYSGQDCNDTPLALAFGISSKSNAPFFSITCLFTCVRGS